MRRIRAGHRLEPTVHDLDALCALVVKTRDGWRCRRCGVRYKPGDRGFHWAHVFSKSRHRTRWSLENSIALCAGHHLNWAHIHPKEFHQWVRDEVLGPERYDALALRFRTGAGVKVDKGVVLLMLKEAVRGLRVEVADRRVHVLT